MRALVTGGNGHLGYNLVKGLVDAGRTVRASVRSLADPAKTSALRQLGAVELVEAELSRPDRFIVGNDELPAFRKMIEVMHRIDPGVKLPLMGLPSIRARRAASARA